MQDYVRSDNKSEYILEERKNIIKEKHGERNPGKKATETSDSILPGYSHVHKKVLKLRICINIISIGLKLITSKIISGISILPDY